MAWRAFDQSLISNLQSRLTSSPGRSFDRCHAPHSVADIIGDEQCAFLVERYADRTTHRFVIAQEAREEILHCAGWSSFVVEGDECNLVAVELAAVPGSMQSDERTRAIALWECARS